MSSQSKSKILIVEDDLEMARLTDMLLTSEGYQCHQVHNGLEVVAAVKKYHPALIVLDIMLPGKSGLELCSELRAFYTGAIIVLTGQDDDITELASLKTGADDFVLKPIKPHVFLARLEVLLKRTVNQPGPSHELKIGDILIQPEKREVKLASGQLLNLTTAEFDILLLLAQNAGQIVTREQCCAALRGIEYDALDRSIDMRVSSLRKKLAQSKTSKEYIVTVRNKGYLLIKE